MGQLTLFKVGDKVKLDGCPFDEQIPEEMLMYTFLVVQTMNVTRVSKPDDLDAPWVEEGAVEGQFIKTDMMPDWTSSAWFKKVE